MIDGLLVRIVRKYNKYALRLADWMEKDIPEGFSVYSFPVSPRRSIRTTNGLELVSKEIRSRTRVISIFPNEASCLRLVSAILIEIDDAWPIEKRS